MDLHAGAIARFQADFLQGGEAILADAEGRVLAVGGMLASSVVTRGEMLHELRNGARSTDLAEGVRAVLVGEDASRTATVELPDGTAANARILSLRSDDGQSASLVVVLSLRIQAADLVRLRRADQIYRLWFERAPSGVCLVATDGRFLRANPAFCRFVGRSEADLLEITFQDITHPDDLSLDVSLLDQVVAGTIDRFDVDKRYLTPAGDVVWAHLTVALVRDQRGRALHLISMIDDITEQRENQNRLTDALEFQRALFDLAPIAMAELAVDGTIQRANPAAGDLVGVPAELLVGQRTVDLGAADERDDALLGLSRLASGELQTNIAHRRLRDATGRLLHLSVHTATVRNSDGEVDRLLMQVVDVTESTELSDQLQESVAQHSSAYREKTALMSALTHDLRAPLATIRILAELLHDAALPPDRRDEIVDRLLREATSTELVLADLTSAEQARAGRIKPRRVEVELNDVVARVIGQQRTTTHNVIVASASQPSAIVADPTLLDRIVANLMANARRHTPDGSTIWVSTEIGVDFADVIVEDDGPGVPDDMIEAIFEPYVRGPHPDRPGSGVGLYLVRQFAEFHGGTATCTNRPSGGARFVVRLARDRHHDPSVAHTDPSGG